MHSPLEKDQVKLRAKKAVELQAKEAVELQAKNGKAKPQSDKPVSYNETRSLHTHKRMVAEVDAGYDTEVADELTKRKVASGGVVVPLRRTG
jgi:hypothetical protein